MKYSALGQRMITAVVYGLALLVPIFLGPIFGIIAIGILCLLTVLEYLKLQDVKGRALYVATGLAVLMYLLITWLLYDEGITNTIKYAIYLGVFFDLLLIYRFLQRKQPFAFTFQVLPATLYIALPLSLLFVFAYSQGPYQPLFILIILTFVWINDVMAYLVGRQIGKTPFYFEVSPNKTWEGTIAGWISCMILSVVYSQTVGVFNPIQWVCLGVLVGLCSSYGDLIESLFKRKKGIKDSGTFLPGHGGLLDRMDSLLFVMPFAALLLLIIQQSNFLN